MHTHVCEYYIHVQYGSLELNHLFNLTRLVHMQSAIVWVKWQVIQVEGTQLVSTSFWTGLECLVLSELYCTSMYIHTYTCTCMHTYMYNIHVHIHTFPVCVANLLCIVKTIMNFYILGIRRNVASWRWRIKLCTCDKMCPDGTKALLAGSSVERPFNVNNV